MSLQHVPEDAPVTGQEMKRGEVPNWEKGMQVHGVFVDSFEVNTKFGVSTLFKIEDPITHRKEVYGAPARLRNLLDQCGIGDLITVRCTGKSASKNGLAWDFKFWNHSIKPEPSDEGTLLDPKRNEAKPQ